MVAALFISRAFGPNGRLYKSRVTGREYLVSENDNDIRVHVNGRCIYGGGSKDSAFNMMELDDCAA